MRRTDKRKGFTLIEMMVVAVIIAMLAAFVAPKVFNKLSKAKVNIAKAGVYVIESTLEEFALDCGRYPTQEEGLEALVKMPDDMEEGKWDSEYIKASKLIDPWGNPYQYLAEGVVNEGTYDVISYGADGKQGGEGKNADIVNE